MWYNKLYNIERKGVSVENLNKHYDCIIVGAGPMGIYAAYEFMLKAPDAKVLLIDKGHDIYNRRCPILEKKAKKCPTDSHGNSGCKPSCSITCGFGGARVRGICEW